MNARVFEFLTDSDWARILESAERRPFAKDEAILLEGSRHSHLFFLRRGFVRIERDVDGQGVAFARLGPGEVFGEMSFLENVGASASVLAEEDVEVDVVDGRHVRDLLGTVPGLSVRFYQSLAVSLSRRLRETTALVHRLNVEDVAQVNRFHRTRVGESGGQELPEGVGGELAEIEREIDGVEAAIRERRSGGADAQRRIEAVCDRIPDLLLRAAQGDDPGGVGSWIFRETFPLLMTSATIARAYTKPRGFADDDRTVARMLEERPEGDGLLGPLVDRWFLGRPLCRSRRSARDRMRRILGDELARGPVGETFRVAALASGTAAELLAVLADGEVRELAATCVDLDREALARAAERARALGRQGRVTFLEADVLRLASGQGMVALAPQSVIYALGFVEYLPFDHAVTLLDWIHDRLAPGGLAVLTNLSERNPDRAFMEHVLEWKVLHRSEHDLVRLFERSRFGGAEVDADESGIALFARARRAR